MDVALACDPPHSVMVHKSTWVADGFRAAGHSVRLVHDLAGVRAADACCDLVLFDHKASGMNRAALAELARRRRGKGDGYVLPERPGGCLAQNVPVPFSPTRLEWDVLVLGSPGYAQRRADARALAAAGFRVLWAGMAASDPVPPGVEWHPWVHPLKLPELVSRCGVVLGVDWRSDLPGYTSDRTYLACGMGACYVARYTDCGSDFPSASYSPAAALAAWIYSSTDELIEIVRLALSDVDERRRRGQWSRQCVMERHTYKHRAEEIVNLVAPARRGAIQEAPMSNS
jgi:hypothetical protein